MATGTDNLAGAASGLRRVVGGLVMVVVLLLVVGVGTGAARTERHGRGASGRWDISDPGWLLDAAASVLVVATVAVAAVLVYAFWPAGRRRPRESDAPEVVHEPPSARWWQKAAAIAPAPALIGGLVWALLATRSSGGPAAPSPPAGLPSPWGSQAPRTGTSAPMIHSGSSPSSKTQR